MPQILSLSQRPLTLSALYGQETLVKTVQTLVAKRPPQVWIFSGPPGTGKTTIATIMSVSYQCTHAPFGEPCAACWAAKSSFAIHEVNASDSTGVEDIREVIRASRFKPVTGQKRVIVLNEVHRLSTNAQDALLDPTEKAPPHLIWILVTTEPNKILLALRGRGVKFQLKTLSITAAEDFLKRAAAAAKIVRPLEPLFEECHMMGVCAPRDLLMALEKYAAGSSPVEAVTGFDENGFDTLRICKAVTAGKWPDLAAAMKAAPPEASRLIRASVAGWLRACLLRSREPAEQERHAKSLIELSTFPFDDAAMAQWLWGILWQICRRYRVRVQ